MPSEHYDILSNLEKDINDKLIKEYNKKMVYLKNGFTVDNIDDLGASIDKISYNPYYSIEKNVNDTQIFNTELNNVIVNTIENNNNKFKYKYNFQNDYNDITINIPSDISDDDTEKERIFNLQHSFVMNETLYCIYTRPEYQEHKIFIYSLWSFNPNIKVNKEIFTGIKINSATYSNNLYYCIYAYPYVIIYADGKIYYSVNLLYWQSISPSSNPASEIYYVNNQSETSLSSNNFINNNMIIIHLGNFEPYIIYPSYTKEELFMRM